MSETTRDADMKIIPQPLSPDGKAWPETMDGMAWAVEFNQRFPAVSVDDALGWFCNAIMRGYDTATSRQSDALAAAQRENARTCQWRYMNWPESDSDYETECGGAWTFIEGGITENGVAFCHRCGGRVLAPSKPKDEEDDVAALRGEGGA